MGEVMPPQKHDYAPWIDEVNQFVAVNGAKALSLRNSSALEGSDTVSKMNEEAMNIHSLTASIILEMASWLSWVSCPGLTSRAKMHLVLGGRFARCRPSIVLFSIW